MTGPKPTRMVLHVFRGITPAAAAQQFSVAY